MFVLSYQNFAVKCNRYNGFYNEIWHKVNCYYVKNRI